MSNGRPPNQGIGVGWSASREPTKYGLWARLSRVTTTLSSSTWTVPQIDGGDLPQRSLVVLQVDPLVQHTRRAESPGQRRQGDAPPRRGRPAPDVAQHPPGAAAQGEEADTTLVQAAQVGVGGQLGVEHPFLRRVPGLPLPESNELQDLVRLVVLGDAGMGVAQDPVTGVAGQEGQDALLAPTA